MTVTVIRPGRLVQVEPDKLTADDIIDFAAALIEVHGWVQHDSGDEKRGWSIHGALGEASRRATQSRGKDDSAARRFRDQANAQIKAKYDMDDIKLNDTSANADEAVQRLLNAKGVTV